MSEELGKIEKHTVDEFKGGRKLFFVPMVISGKELQLEILVKIDHYWDEVDSQLSGLEAKLGEIKHIYQELIPEDGEPGINLIKDLDIGSYNLVHNRFEKGAKFEALEDKELLAELMDWSRCISSGLQSQRAFTKIYELYDEANTRRNETITKKLNDSLKPDESGILIMAEGHQIKFSPDIKLFYIAPPSLDGIKRWMRDYDAKIKEENARASQTQNPAATNNQL